GLGNVVYSSLTINTGSGTATLNASDVKIGTMTNPRFVITEVENDETATEGSLVVKNSTSVEVINGTGDLEASYVTWKAASGADWYNVYVKANTASSYTKLDSALVRQYSGYYRADAVGLKAGTYSMKIAPTDSEGNELGSYTEVNNLVVEAHDRSGYGFVNGTSSGAYNEDGTLKSSAVVLYITEETKNTVSLDVTGATSNPCVGLQTILDGFKKGGDSRPLCVRFIGNITDLSYMLDGDIVIDENNKTVVNGITFEGIGDDATINGWGIRIKNSSNVEVRNLGFMNCNSVEGDCLGLQQSNNHVWVHNCNFFYGAAGSDSDQVKGDGALDTKTSTYITHSYNRFHDTGKSNLQGMKSESTENYITYHHNWYDHSDSRHPRIRTCTVHIYNNYFDGIAKYGVGVTMGASAFVENNYFRSTSTLKPMLSSMQGTDIANGTANATFSSEAGGIIKSFGNIYDVTNGGTLKLMTYQDGGYNSNPNDSDCYEASSRDEQVPSGYTTLSGGTTYSNFDTAASFYEYEVDSAEEARVKVQKWAGRVGHGDFVWEFTDEDDKDYGVNTTLKSALTNYSSDLKKVGDTTISSGSESGGEAGGDTGETGGETGGTTTPSVEGEVIYIPARDGYTGKDGISLSSTSTSNKATEAVYVLGYEVPAKTAAKVDSSQHITLTPSTDSTLTLYTMIDNLSVNGNKVVGTVNGDYYEIVVELTAGTPYDITKGDGENALYALKLTPKNSDPIAVEDVSLDNTSADLKVGESLTLTATVSPSNATNTAVTWTSSDESVATVVNGKITAVAKGSATITVTTEDGSKTATCSVNVTNVAPTSIAISNAPTVMAVNDTATLTATVSPSNTTVKTLTWSTSDESVATVDANGKVTALKAGNVTITATSTEDASVKATCTIEVKAEIVKVTSISLNYSTATLKAGDTLQLTVTVTPDNAEDKTVTWSTSDSAIATVSTSGLVTVVGEGKVTITATSNSNTSATATCTIEASYVRYTVTYMDGSTNKGTQSVIEGQTTTALAVAKDGYAIDGWYTDSALTSRFDFSTPITADITLYASWVVATMEVSYSQGNFESAAIEWEDTSASTATVSYKLASASDEAYVAVDKELIRQIDGDTARVDVVGLQGGKTYNFKIVSSRGETVETIKVRAYDRSGFAHFNYTDGVGAYNDDGTLKENAIVLYVTDETKNTVTLSYGGVTVTGIGNILNSVGQDTGSGTAANGGTANSNKGILKLLAKNNIPLVVRFIGCVSDSGLYKKGTFDASSAPLIEGLTIYNSTGNGGTAGDNGHMARMKSAKDVTLEGIGEDATIDGWGFHFMCESSAADLGKSFEVRNLTFINTPEDAIGMEGVQASASTSAEITASVERCWIHNNEFYGPSISNPAESDKSEGDGSCDFKRGQYFTCSYNYFEGCHKTNLVGSADTSLQYNLSYHHNYWYLCKARGPLTRNANVHMYNNVFEGQTDYCMNTRADAYIFSEYNLFYMCKSPQRVDGGAIKSYNDSFSSCINNMAGTVVTDKSTTVANSCQYAYGKVDYSKFDTDSKLSYIPTGDYELQTSVTEARKTIAAFTGVTKRNIDSVEDVSMSDISYLPSGVTPVEIDSYPCELTPGKVSKTVYAFKLDRSATVTIAYSSDEYSATGVLVNEAGECFLTASGSVILAPGIYLVQPMNIQAGDSAALTEGTFKEITINKITFAVYSSAELNEKLLADYNTKATAVQAATIVYDNASYQLIVSAQNAYASLSSDLKSQVTVPYSVVENAFAAYVAAGETYVEGLISAIGTVNADSGSKISAARLAYQELISIAPTATVDNYSTLTAAEASYESYAVTGLINKIEALADPSTATTEEAIDSLLAEYQAVQNEYDAFDEDKKTQVTNYSKVTEGIAKLQAAKAPYTVKAQIAALPEKANVTLTDGTAISAARKAYDALTEDQQTIVGDITRLTDAEAALAELAAATTVAIFTKDDTTLATSAGFTVSGSYKSGVSFTYNGITYNQPLKLESSTSVTFSTVVTQKLTIKIYTAGGQLKVDGVVYEDTDSDGFIVIDSLAAGDHSITKGSGDPNLCYVILEAVA
ncbi:MAG: Ig-like domain-containing protein, partial [Candidatus Coproplasma sp.]